MRHEIYKKLINTEGFVSGESLSSSLGISRAALWKHINAVKSDGANIDSVASKGYKLRSAPEVPRAEYIKAYLEKPVEIIYKKSVGSTNDEAKTAAQEKKTQKAVFIANEQTAGKGRKGRTWLSPANEGLYMSFLVRPNIDAAQISGITIMAAVALCRAIEKTAGISVGIKWPNDILIEGKKTAGILTESMLGMDGVDYIVCGMGINVSQKKFDGELSGTACSLGMSGQSVNKTLLASAVINEFFAAYDIFITKGLAMFMDEFRQRSVIDGEVTVISPNRQDKGLLIGFDDTGAILLDCAGEKKRFVAGEVSLRGEKGYV